MSSTMTAQPHIGEVGNEVGAYNGKLSLEEDPHSESDKVLNRLKEKKTGKKAAKRKISTDDRLHNSIADYMSEDKSSVKGDEMEWKSNAPKIEVASDSSSDLWDGDPPPNCKTEVEKRPTKRKSTDEMDKSEASYATSTTLSNGKDNTEVVIDDMDLLEQWPFTRCKIVLQLDDALNNNGKEEDDNGGNVSMTGLKSGWAMRENNHVFYDKMTSSQVKLIRDQLENARLNKFSTFPEIPGPPRFTIKSLKSVMKPTDPSPLSPNETEDEMEEEPLSPSPEETVTNEVSLSPPPTSPRRPRKRQTRVAAKRSRQRLEERSKNLDDSENDDDDKPSANLITQDNIKREEVQLEAVFKCPYCYEVFPEANPFIDHLEGQNYCQSTLRQKSNDEGDHHDSNNTEEQEKSDLRGKPVTPKKTVEQLDVKVKVESPQSISIQNNNVQVPGGKTSLVCVICGESFSRIHELDSHMNLHSGETPFKCPLCKEGFPDLASTNEHVTATHGAGKGMSLLELLERSKSRKSRATVTTVSSEVDSQTEELPEPKISQRRTTAKKTKKVNKAKKTRNSNDDAEATDFETKVTSTTTPVTPELELSEEERDGNSQTEERWFIQLPSVRGRKPYKCLECNKTFYNRAQHLASHTRTIKFGCSTCSKSFSLHENLLRHERIHTGEQGSSESEKVIPDKPSLERDNDNMEVHNDKDDDDDEEDLKCAVCSKQFDCRDSLKTHLLSHAAAKAHKCSVCDKAFLEKGNLRRHMLIHADDGSVPR